jgi:hypothetical protein
MDTNQLLRRVDAYLARTGLKESTLGQMAIENSRAIPNLRRGARMWPDTAARLVEFMKNNGHRRGYSKKG